VKGKVNIPFLENVVKKKFQIRRKKGAFPLF